jgi:hypothetical protein
MLIAFWEKEIELVQKAMGFKYSARIEFDRMDLSNEDSEKALLIQLADRNLISDELLQVKFGIDPDMEKSRLNRESRERDSSRMVPKAGPWNDPQVENALKKIALQTGIVTPSQVGLELDKKKSGEKTALEQKTPKAGPSTKLANDSPESLPGIPGQGRPKLSKDSSTRQNKKFSPQTGASLMLWANEAQEKINEIINPILLDFYAKKNLRSLSKAESKEMDIVKTKVFFSIQPHCTIDDSIINKVFANIQSENHTTVVSAYNNWLKPIKTQINRDLTVEEIKQLKSSFYSMVYNSLTEN